MNIEDVENEDAFHLYTEDDFIMLVAMLEEINSDGKGTDWEGIMYLCFLGAAICASYADMDADEFMVALRSVRVTEDGTYGEA